jgi:hypothetical protein
LGPAYCSLTLAISTLTFSVAVWPREADLPLSTARGDLLDLLVHFKAIFLAPLIPLVFPHLLSSLNFCQQLFVRFVKLVLVVLVKVFLWIHEPLVNWQQSLTLWGLKAILDCDRLLIVVTVHGECRGLCVVVGILSLWELYLH